MNIDYPAQNQIDSLRALWQQAFGDTDAWTENFFAHGFAPDRCRCITIDGTVAAALYWFDCTFQGQPIAYLYGIATAKAQQGKGMCRALLENTHAHLKYLGYAGAILVPAEEKLFAMYEKMGYEVCSSVTEFSCTAAAEKAALRPIDTAEFTRLRRTYLPKNGVLQEGQSLDFLATMADFYAGGDFLLTVSKTEPFAPELLGNPTAAPQILAALGQTEGHFRTNGADKPFSMYHSLGNFPKPDYFGLAFD